MRGRAYVVGALAAVVWTAACGRARPVAGERQPPVVAEAPHQADLARSAPAKPQLVHEVMPPLPAAARRKGVKGPVQVEIEIDPAGMVSVKCVLQGDPLLNRAAEEAVTKWKYEWASSKEAPAPVDETVFVRFRED